MGEVVVNYVTSTLTNGETVEFVGTYGNDYFKENGDFRFSTNLVYTVIARDGSQENVLPMGFVTMIGTKSTNGTTSNPHCG